MWSVHLLKFWDQAARGNAALLRTGEVNILLDAGFSCKKLQSLLKNEGISSEQLDGIFLTHEHNDHCAGLRGLSKLETYQYLPIVIPYKPSNPNCHGAPTGKFLKPEKPLPLNRLKFIHLVFPMMHTIPLVFFSNGARMISLDPPNSLAWVTDLGFVPSLVRERIRQAKILVIESNYCTKMLEEDEKRPWSLKQRIRSRHGHLSNQTTF